MKLRSFINTFILAVSATTTNAQGIAGTWNVISESTYIHNCKKTKPGSPQAYEWIVSTESDGKVKISAQGDTGFKKLQGVLVPSDGLLVLDGQSSSVFSKASSWFK